MICDGIDEIIAAYRNSGPENDALHAEFTALAQGNPLLASHRRYVEENHLGFGDAAFHYLWLLILMKVTATASPRLIEIGVYKGQIISLWALLLRNLNCSGEIHAISPLRGDPISRSNLMRRVRGVLSARYRERLRNGDFYESADYEQIIRQLFQHFGLEWQHIKLHRGLSTDALIRSTVQDEIFDVVYVDGDHTYAGALADYEFFGPRVRPGGFLIADDAGCNLPGTTFWKGHPSVSEAAKVIPHLGFRNVLNVGHNCVYQRLRSL
jgi:Methyltransferase domain